MKKPVYLQLEFLSGITTALLVSALLLWLQPEAVLALGCLVFLAAFTWNTLYQRSLLAWLVQGGACLLIYSQTSLGFTAIFGVIFSAGAPFYLSALPALLTTLVAALIFIANQVWHQVPSVWIWGLLWVMFHLFGLAMTTRAQREMMAREHAEALNRELKATQKLLQETGRQAERLRIARDLHDRLGHQLTGLSIGLQVLRRQQPQLSTVPALEAQATDALQAVRMAVEDMRQQPLALAPALAELASPATGLTLHLDLCEPDSPPLARLIFDISREAITNTLRHAGASDAWLTLSRHHQQWRWHYRDNGKLAKHWQEGNGLRGLQERLQQAGSQLQIAREQGAMALTAEFNGSGP
ncbi:sensor histidine kinase [Gallaecimonas sp. GXIMD1310]|uniref:sensor histidine kinase n=1 Tax=Gallaecimonas sp. GXIMD1310 TaxID=3131926 RepID=UPI003245E736